MNLNFGLESEGYEKIDKVPLRSDLVIDCITLPLAVDLNHDAVVGKTLPAGILPGHSGGQEEVAAPSPLPGQAHPGA